MNADAIADLLLTETGQRADGLWSAPGRVNLIGEHTDYNRGFVLPFAIDRRTTIAAHRTKTRSIEICSTGARGRVQIELTDLDSQIQRHAAGAGAPTLPTWAYYPLGVAWALIREAGVCAAQMPGVRMVIDSEVPIGAGLSSSAALEGAVGTALNDLWDLGLDRDSLARVGHIAENEAVGAPTGMMDQVAAMFGRSDHAILLDCRDLTTSSVPLGLDAAGLVVLVIDSRVHHAHAEGGYSSRRAGCAAAAVALGFSSLRELAEDDLARAANLLDDTTWRWVRHVVTENRRVLDTVDLLGSDGPRAIGPTLNASHASMRDDFAITIPEIDVAVEAATRAGAIGARMTGGGFGGAAIALTPTESVAEVSAAVQDALAGADLTTPDIFVVRPSDGARRDE